MFYQGIWKQGKQIVAGIAALLLIAVAGCGSDGPSQNNAADKSGGTSSAVSASAEKIYQVGETASLFDFKLTIDEVQKSDSYHQQILKDGMEFVMVKVTLENTGNESKPYHYASFKLFSSASEQDLNMTTLDIPDELHQGDLAPGEKVSGFIPYQHPKNDPVMNLQFTPNIMSDRLIIFQLQ
jgi:uncharacterized membrane protein YfhO